MSLSVASFSSLFGRLTHIYLFLSLTLGSDDDREKFAAIARSKYIDKTLWGTFLNDTRRALIKQPFDVFDEEQISSLCEEFESILEDNPEYLHQEGKKYLQHMEVLSSRMQSCRQKLFERLLAKCEEDHQISIKVHRTLCLTTDFRSPHEYVSVVNTYFQTISVTMRVFI